MCVLNNAYEQVSGEVFLVDHSIVIPFGIEGEAPIVVTIEPTTFSFSNIQHAFASLTNPSHRRLKREFEALLPSLLDAAHATDNPPKTLLEVLSNSTSEIGHALYKQVLFHLGKFLDDMLVDEIHNRRTLPGEIHHLTGKFLEFGSGNLLGPRNMLGTYWCNSLFINIPHHIFSMGIDGSSVGRRKTIDMAIVLPTNHCTAVAPQVNQGTPTT